LARKPVITSQKNHHSNPVAAVLITETPFNQRHCCWFCGEPNSAQFIFPTHNSLSSYQGDKSLLVTCPHPVISVPVCNECHKWAKQARVNTIWEVKLFVKKQLIKRYAKDLAIGINWTEEELASSEFEQGNFSGFARSAWFIFDVAKGRMNYSGWPLVVEGIELNELLLDERVTEPFSFDGMIYPSLADAISHYAKIFLLDEHYVSEVLQHLGNGHYDEKSFAKAVRFCRLLVNATPSERKTALKTLILEG
jgi:hypothetical protein